MSRTLQKFLQVPLSVTIFDCIIAAYYSIILYMPIECLLIDDDIDDQEIFLMALNGVGTPVHCIVTNDCIDGLKKLSLAASYALRIIFF